MTESTEKSGQHVTAVGLILYNQNVSHPGDASQPDDFCQRDFRPQRVNARNTSRPIVPCATDNTCSPSPLLFYFRMLGLLGKDNILWLLVCRRLEFVLWRSLSEWGVTWEAYPYLPARALGVFAIVLIA